MRGGIRAALSGRFRRFEADLVTPAYAQNRVLREILGQTARTDYGKNLGVHGAESYVEFARQVPVVEYEEIRSWVDLQAESHRPVLVAEPIVVYEETSGSSGPSKLIPYTPSLLGSFDSMFRLWVYDLLNNGPPLRTGKTFISISPPVRKRRSTPSGVAVGFEDDTLYLSSTIRRVLGSRFLVPSDLGHARSWETFRRALATWLVSESELEIMSIWSPTYLTTLLDWIADNRYLITEDLSRGYMEVDDGQIALRSHPDAITMLNGGDTVDWQRVWPRLRLISCWADGASTGPVERLRYEFPGVWIQPKGLLATEAPLTLPLCHAAAPVPLLGEVFLEFESSRGEILRLHELENGMEYSLIVTQRGGLVRYRMNDHVRCERRVRATPTLRFLGRTHDVTDLVGEKLNERFVREILARLFGERGAFSFLVPVVRTGERPHYACITDARWEPGSAQGRGPELQQSLDQELRRAVQYRTARGLEQLGSVEVLQRPDARDRYTRLFLGRGIRWGDIKCEALVGSPTEAELEALVS